MSDAKTKEPGHLVRFARRADLEFVAGEGAWLTGSDGRRYLDFSSGVAVNNCGHRHPRLVEALVGAAQKPWHVSNLFRNSAQERLADRLSDVTFADRAFFCNSGLEAAEAAIKMARRWQFERGQEQRTKIVALQGSFHGRSLAALAAAGNEEYLRGFGPKCEGFVQVPPGDIAALRAQLDGTTAAVLMEPVQGEGGVRALADEYLQQVRAACDAAGALLIFDEVQTGVGRTGKLFAHEWPGVTPDIMMVAKGLGGGIPIGAVLARAEVADSMPFGWHGNTFGGNPLATSVANAVLDVVLAPGFLDHVVRMSELLVQRLQALSKSHPEVFKDVRGRGLLLGMKCGPVASQVADLARSKGLLVLTAGENVLRLLPALIIGEAEVDAAMRILDACAAEMEVPA